MMDQTPTECQSWYGSCGGCKFPTFPPNARKFQVI